MDIPLRSTSMFIFFPAPTRSHSFPKASHSANNVLLNCTDTAHECLFFRSRSGVLRWSGLHENTGGRHGMDTRGRSMKKKADSSADSSRWSTKGWSDFGGMAHFPGNKVTWDVQILGRQGHKKHLRDDRSWQTSRATWHTQIESSSLGFCLPSKPITVLHWADNTYHFTEGQVTHLSLAPALAFQMHTEPITEGGWGREVKSILVKSILAALKARMPEFDSQHSWKKCVGAHLKSQKFWRLRQADLWSYPAS